MNLEQNYECNELDCWCSPINICVMCYHFLHVHYNLSTLMGECMLQHKDKDIA